MKDLVNFLLMSSQVPLRTQFFSALLPRNRCRNKSSALFVEVTEEIQENFKIEVKLTLKKQMREVTRTKNFAGKGK